jgi:hypothetical protein
MLTCTSFSASANVVAETSGPAAGAVLNAGGAPGVACVALEAVSAALVVASFALPQPDAMAASPKGARIRN